MGSQHGNNASLGTLTMNYQNPVPAQYNPAAISDVHSAGSVNSEHQIIAFNPRFKINSGFRVPLRIRRSGQLGSWQQFRSSGNDAAVPAASAAQQRSDVVQRRRCCGSSVGAPFASGNAI